MKLSLQLIRQGMTGIAERVDAANSIKTLDASRPPADPSSRSALMAHDTCVCGEPSSLCLHTPPAHMCAMHAAAAGSLCILTALVRSSLAPALHLRS